MLASPAQALGSVSGELLVRPHVEAVARWRVAEVNRPVFRAAGVDNVVEVSSYSRFSAERGPINGNQIDRNLGNAGRFAVVLAGRFSHEVIGRKQAALFPVEIGFQIPTNGIVEMLAALASERHPHPIGNREGGRLPDIFDFQPGFEMRLLVNHAEANDFFKFDGQPSPHLSFGALSRDDVRPYRETEGSDQAYGASQSDPKLPPVKSGGFLRSDGGSVGGFRSLPLGAQVGLAVCLMLPAWLLIFVGLFRRRWGWLCCGLSLVLLSAALWWLGGPQ